MNIVNIQHSYHLSLLRVYNDVRTYDIIYTDQTSH